MYASATHRGLGRRLGRHRRLGADSSSLWSGITQNSLNPFVFLPADWNYITGKDPSFLATPSWDVLSSAAYGTPTAGMYQQIQAQGAADIAAASGGNATLAQQQQALLAQNIADYQSGSGGVAPSVANVFQTPNLLSQLTDPSSVLFWAVIGIGALALYSTLK
jgi:hypothetical protein